MDHRAAHAIAEDLFTRITTNINIATEDFLTMPGPPGASTTPVKTFCLVTRTALDEPTRNTILAVAATLQNYGDSTDIYREARAVLRIQYDVRTTRMLSGYDNLANVNAAVRAEETTHLWILLKTSPADLTPELIHTLTNVTIDPWYQSTKYGDYTTAIGPTDEPCVLHNGHPKIHRISTDTYQGAWAILPQRFPNEYHLGQGKVESYLGATPPQFVHFIPSSGDPADVHPEHYIYMPEPLRVRLFIQQATLASSNLTNLNAQQAPLTTTSQSSRRNAKGMTITFSHPGPVNQPDPEALHAQQHIPRGHIPPPRPPAPAPSSESTSVMASLHRLENFAQQTHQRLNNLEGHAKDNEGISTIINDLHMEATNLCNQLAAELTAHRDNTTLNIHRLYDNIAALAEDNEALRSLLSTHV